MCCTLFSSLSRDTMMNKSMLPSLSLPCFSPSLSLPCFSPSLFSAPEQYIMEKPSYYTDHNVSLVISLIISTFNSSIGYTFSEDTSLLRNFCKMSSFRMSSLETSVKLSSYSSILEMLRVLAADFMSISDDSMSFSIYLVILRE